MAGKAVSNLTVDDISTSAVEISLRSSSYLDGKHVHLYTYGGLHQYASCAVKDTTRTISPRQPQLKRLWWSVILICWLARTSAMLEAVIKVLTFAGVMKYISRSKKLVQLRLT